MTSRCTRWAGGWAGKCVTVRGPNAGIEEHGIHRFQGCHYNALLLMVDYYKALTRATSQPLGHL